MMDVKRTGSKAVDVRVYVLVLCAFWRRRALASSRRVHLPHAVEAGTAMDARWRRLLRNHLGARLAHAAVQARVELTLSHLYFYYLFLYL